eukprot:g3765.t1
MFKVAHFHATKARLGSFDSATLRSKALEWSRLLAITGGSQVAIQLLGFASGIFVIRLLSQDQYALYTIANAMLGTLAVLADGGISTGVMACGGRVWEDKSKLGGVLVTGIKLRHRFAIGSVVIAMPLLAYLLYDHGAGWWAILLICLSILPAFFTGLTETILSIGPKLHQNVTPLQKIQVGASLLRFVLSFASILVFPFAAVALFAAGLPQILANFRLRKLVREKADLDAEYEKETASEILKSVKRILPGAIYFSFSGQISIWLLSLFGTTSAVAQIGGLSRLTMLVSSVGLVFGILVVPRFSRLANESKGLRRFFLQFTAAQLALIVLMLGGVIVLGPYFLMLLGEGYEGLELELFLLFVGASLSLLKGSWFSLFAGRGLILPAAVSVGANLLAQAGRFLEETLLSVLDQDYPNIEFIVIDGGSTDESVEIIKKYSDRIAYWVSEKDRGQSHAINKGMDQATGDIIGWVNSDDVYLPGAFRKVAEAFVANPEVILVHGDRVLIDEDSHVSGWAFHECFNPEKTNFNICSETAFWRASATKGERIKEQLQFAMDLEFFCRLYKLGPILKIDEYLGCFRCYPDNKSSTIAHIGRQEGEEEWNRLFGEGSYSRVPQWLPGHSEVAIFLTDPGEYGVQLFFVLSGFLVGGLYFNERMKYGKVDFITFILRRISRTMPPYFIVLVISYLGVFVLKGEKFDITYLFFFQNYLEEIPYFLVSWSLCVEEHFYAVLPFYLILAYNVFKLFGGAATVILVTITVLLPVLFRSFGYEESAAYGYARTATHFHFDSMGFGVILAWVYSYKPHLAKRNAGTFPMKIVLLCGCLEFGRDGVGDYTRRLAEELIRMGNEVRIIALNDSVDEAAKVEMQTSGTADVSVLRLDGRRGWSTRSSIAKAWILDFSPDWFSLQYVPYSFHPKGLAWRLPEIFRGLAEGKPVHIMFHETWIGFTRISPLKHKVYGFLQKSILKRLVEKLKPAVIHTSNRLYSIQLSREKVECGILPIFSNISPSDSESAWIRRKFDEIGIRGSRGSWLVLGIFGSIHPEFSARKLIERYQTEAREAGKKLVLLVIGRSGEGLSSLEAAVHESQAGGILYQNFGEAEPAQISEFIRSLDYGVATMPKEFMDKSGTIAAFRVHGVPVIESHSVFLPEFSGELARREKAAGELDKDNFTPAAIARTMMESLEEAEARGRIA